MRRFLACTFALLLVPGLAFAQAWPNKPVKLVVPFPAGGDCAGVPFCAAPGEHAPAAHAATSMSAVANGFMDSSITETNTAKPMRVCARR